MVQIALPIVAPGRHCLRHVAITCAPCLASWPGDSSLQLARRLGRELVTWQNCQLWPLLPNLKQASTIPALLLFTVISPVLQSLLIHSKTGTVELV